MYHLGVARDLTERIPSARLVELSGTSTLHWSAVDEIGSSSRAPAGACLDRVLATILFTDIVGSTGAAKLGDSAWSRLVEQHHAAVRKSSFATPAKRSTPQATASSPSSTRPARDPLRARYPARALAAGSPDPGRLHTGEVERVRGEKPRGIAVNVAARVSSLAGGGVLLRLDGPRPSRWLRSRVRRPRRAQLKGLGEARHVFAALESV